MILRQVIDAMEGGALIVSARDSSATRYYLHDERGMWALDAATVNALFKNDRLMLMQGHKRSDNPCVYRIRT